MGEHVASKYSCRCGEVVRTNLFEGHGLHLLVSENLLDPPESQIAAGVDPLLHRVILESSIVAVCPRCGRLAVIDNDYNVKLFELASEP